MILSIKKSRKWTQYTPAYKFKKGRRMRDKRTFKWNFFSRFNYIHCVYAIFNASINPIDQTRKPRELR